MRKVAFFVLLVALPPLGVMAQRRANAPPAAASGKVPDTVYLEELTWAEVRDMVKAGKTTVIVGTAGQEQKGPHMVDSEHHLEDPFYRRVGRKPEWHVQRIRQTALPAAPARGSTGDGTFCAHGPRTLGRF